MSAGFGGVLRSARRARFGSLVHRGADRISIPALDPSRRSHTPTQSRPAMTSLVRPQESTHDVDLLVRHSSLQRYRRVRRLLRERLLPECVFSDRLFPDDVRGRRNGEAEPHFSAVDAKHRHLDPIANDNPFTHFTS